MMLLLACAGDVDVGGNAHDGDEDDDGDDDADDDVFLPWPTMSWPL